jgi:hypothetical protein
VAGGGAGGGGSGSDVSAKGMILGGAGGSGGGPGGPGGPDPHGDLGGQPGHQGNQASGGVAGANSAEAPATDGQLGKGGYGGTAPAGGGGGGGGGLYGGGGGGAGTTTVVDPAKFILATAGGGGGGGGSSGMPAGAAGVSSVAIEQTKPGGASTTFSWQRPAPGASTQPAASVTANAATLNGSVDPNGYPVTDCHFELTPAPAAGPDVPCGQQIGAGNSPVAVSANVAGLAGSTAYRYKLVVASAEGSSSGDQVDFTTEPGETATPPPPGAPDPRLGALTLSPSRFRVAARGRRRAGTTIAFSVPQPAKVAITFERAQPGRRKYKRVRGVLRVTVPAGSQRVRFLGKVGGRKLRPGRYRVSAVATDAAGHSSASQHAAATVLR